MKRALLVLLVLPLALAGCGGGGSKAPTLFNVETVMAGADFPTQIRFAPDGRLFFIEKATGNVRIIENGNLLPTPFFTFAIDSANEKGMLGLALDPEFQNNGFVYVCYADGNAPRIRIVRLTATGNSGGSLTPIVDDLPVTDFHNGGRIAFGPDGKLYATVGDHQDPSTAQLTTGVNGKVLRYNPDGSIPGDNPIAGNPMFTYGHRNCFGIAFHPTAGTPYVSENGPNCDDEINRLVPGDNYGWRPGQPCNDMDPNYTLPITRLNPTVAPTGVCFYTGSLFPDLAGDLLVASYNDGALRRYRVDENNGGQVVSSAVLVKNLSGGLLDVAVGPDGFIYLAGVNGILRLVPKR